MDALRRHIRRFGPLWAILGSILLLLIFAPGLAGRPGGGHSYSGGGGFSGGGGYSGGGGDSDGEAIGFIIYLIFRYPHIAIPILIAIYIYGKVSGAFEKVSTTVSSQYAEKGKQNAKRVDDMVQNYRKEGDPYFSETLFLDFAQHFYYRFHHMRSKPEFQNLRPYLTPDVMEKVKTRNTVAVDVSELVIGSCFITRIEQTANYDYISLTFEANYTETRSGHSSRLDVQDYWIMRRKKGVRSLGPDKMGELCCPNCGGTLEQNDSGECVHCGTLVEPGDHTWELYRITVGRHNVMKGHQFGAYAQEVGTLSPSVRSPGLDAEMQHFAQIHSIPDAKEWSKTWSETVVKPTFVAIYQSWESQDWEKARPLMTDFLFRSHYYWIKAYEKEGLINRLRDLQVHRTEIVKVDIDYYYEALTVRIHASCKDYLETKKGKHVAGNKQAKRAFSEYWTFIRRSGVEKPDSEFKVDTCPNCGAPIKMGMAGICGYCDAKVTTGEFGWVLTRITQDEAYHG